MGSDAGHWFNEVVVECLVHQVDFFTGGEKKDMLRMNLGVPKHGGWSSMQALAWGRRAYEIHEEIQQEHAISDDHRWILRGRVAGKSETNAYPCIIVKSIERRQEVPLTASVVPDVETRIEGEVRRTSELATVRRANKRLKKVDHVMAELAKWALENGGLEAIREAGVSVYQGKADIK